MLGFLSMFNLLPSRFFLWPWTCFCHFNVDAGLVAISRYPTIMTMGDSDIGDIVMLVTLWWWLIWESLCWRLFSLCWWFFLCIKSITNIPNRSPTSQNCHQHIWSPTSVTNIDVTMTMTWLQGRGLRPLFLSSIRRTWVRWGPNFKAWTIFFHFQNAGR